MAKGNLSFSYSKMSLYRECPQKYKFRYIHKIAEEPKYYFAFGHSMHKAMEFLYGVKQAPFPTLEQVLDSFDTDWRSTSYKEKGYASVSKELEGYDEGRRIIVSYYQKHKDSLHVPLSVEMRTTLDIDNLSLISIIDRVDYLGNGRVAIVDYKTGKTVQREPDQLYMYQKVMEASPVLAAMVEQADGAKEVKVERMSFYHLPTLKMMDFDPAPEAEIKVFWDGVLATADEIRQNIFTPSPSESKCRFCDYKTMCPIYTGVEYEEFIKTPKPSPAPKTATTEDSLSSKIDELASLGQKYAALKKEIIAIMKEKSFNQHFGTNYKVELNQKETLDFEDKQAVVDYLKQQGLLKKTLVPTLATIEELFADPDVAQDVKDKLKTFSKTIKSMELQIKKVD